MLDLSSIIPHNTARVKAFSSKTVATSSDFKVILIDMINDFIDVPEEPDMNRLARVP
jgi:hypothetical protein